MMNDLTQPFTNRLFGNLNDIVNEALRNFGPTPTNRAPGAYRYENDDSYSLRLEVPGYSKEQVSLSITDRELTVSAEDAKARSNYERTISLPDTIDKTEITAKLEDGILELRFPKAKIEQATARTISID